MPRQSFYFLFLLVITSAVVLADKSELDDRSLPTPRIHHDRYLDIPFESSSRVTHFAQAADTYVLGHYTFDGPSGPAAEGWIGLEGFSIGVKDTFFHVADSLELNGGDQGKLIVLEGAQSLWCGVAPEETGELCSHATLPGYGNSWSQYFTSVAFPHTGDVQVSFLGIWDSEPAEDFTYLQFLNKDGYWETLADYDWLRFDNSVQLESFVIPDSVLGDSTQVRFYFRSDGAWSDEDGLWPTDGAIVIDSLRIADTDGVIDFQDFESESPGDHVTHNGFWSAHTIPTPGNFSGLFPGMTVLQEDGCTFNASTLWGFFNGSTDDYACGGHPEQLTVPGIAVPSYNSTDYLNNEIWSPIIEWNQDTSDVPIPETAGTTLLEFDVYRDLSVNSLVFYAWAVRSFDGDCGRSWQSDRFVYYGDRKDWHRHRVPLTGYIEPGTERIQVALRVLDMCPYWCGLYGDGSCHSHAPLFDNVRIVRIDVPGPSWGMPSYNDYMFQDNFASDGTLTGTVPIDGPRLNTSDTPRDYAMVQVSSLAGIGFHIPGSEASGPAVYCYVKDVSPDKSGSVVSDDLAKNPWISTEGGWTVLQCYSTGSGGQGPHYTIDLNDALYQPGDTVFYYFSARDANGVMSYWSAHTGTAITEAEVRANPMEVTCLPANALNGATDILYVDGFDGFGAESYFASAFEWLSITPDRFDVTEPDFLVGSGPGGRVVDVAGQLASVYKTIIYNTGYFRSAGIHDGSQTDDINASSDDFGMLYEFLDMNPNQPCVYLSGDNLASWWSTRTGTGAADMRTTYMNFNVVSSSHTAVGEAVSPLVFGLPGSCFDRGGGRLDRLLAFGGGCSGVNDFDVLEPTGSSQAAMMYVGNPSHVAVLTQITPNSAGDIARVVLAGFSFHNIRDPEPGEPPARAQHLEAILSWFGNAVGDPTGVSSHVRLFENALAQNVPNPFNPSTTIRYSIADRGHVSLKIYSVTGALVRTLVNQTQQPRAGGYDITWNGTNNEGHPVSSGVYFYNLTVNGFTRTKKMLLLK